MSESVLVVLCGLPATGKSTVARELLREIQFSYVRIDSIEQALRESGEMGSDGVQGAGYEVAYAVVGDLLRSGSRVLVECVNPLALTREAWQKVAANCHTPAVEVELFCSDKAKHKERAETRVVDVSGLSLPEWDAIQSREHDEWDRAILRIDTSATSPKEAAHRILASLRSTSD